MHDSARVTWDTTVLIHLHTDPSAEFIRQLTGNFASAQSQNRRPPDVPPLEHFINMKYSGMLDSLDNSWMHKALGEKHARRY